MRAVILAAAPRLIRQLRCSYKVSGLFQQVGPVRPVRRIATCVDKQVIISLSEAVVWVGQGHHTGRYAPSVWC